jgi:hypothetical protein
MKMRSMSPILRYGAASGALAALVLTGVQAASASTPAAQPAPSGHATLTVLPAAPPGFLAQSTSWVDKSNGYLLGSAPCGSKTCSDVLGTTDGGKTWSLLGHPHAPIIQAGQEHSGISEVRFGTTSTGWAFAPLLRHTDDGGVTWTEESIPGDQGQVLSLATTVNGAWAVVSPCKWGHFGACRKQPLTLWRTLEPSSTHWMKIQTLPYNFAANIAALGTTVYVVDPQLEFGGDDVLLYSSDGVTFDTRTAPCDHSQDLELLQAVPTSATTVALLCDGDPGFSKAVKSVYVSTDTGQTDKYRGTMGLYGIQAELAASPSGNLAVASWSDGSFMYINDSEHGKTWQMPEGIGDGGLGWNDVVYVTNKEAYVVYSPVSQFEPQGQLWVTHDAGRSWQVVSL